jgi:threonine dehydrogenase-like Zn-dependent dehydrogenase
MSAQNDKLYTNKIDIKNDSMPALVFEMKMGKLIKAFIRGKRNPSGYWKHGGPVSIQQVPIPKLVSEDWVIVKTVYCGICGSDMKELTLSGAPDNPLQTFLSFPQIMGHEPVGIIEKVGSKVKKLKPGDRIAISPWFPCKPRGISPECSRCKIGDFTHCANFTKGNLPVGMHLGVATGFGGFAPYISVHESQCFIIPDSISFEQAVVADPFSVAFHSCITLDPKPESTIVVFGLGIIGLLTVLCLKNLFHVHNVVCVGRHPIQAEMAMKFGASKVYKTRGSELVEEIAKDAGVDLLTPSKGSKWAISGPDGIIDTICSAETMEADVRFLKAQGRLVLTGVSTPERYESTPQYFKELEIIGSNAFAIEYYNGKRAHAFEFFLEFLKNKLIDTSGLVTHKFPIDHYTEAFDVLSKKGSSNAIKVVFDFTQ